MDLIIILFAIIVMINKAKKKKNEERPVRNFSDANKKTDYTDYLKKDMENIGKVIENLTEIEEEDLYSNSTHNSGYDKELAEEKYRQRMLKEELLQKRREKESKEYFCVEHYLDPLTAPFYPGNEKKEKDSFCVEDYLFPTLAPYYPKVEEQVMELAAK